jgi:site-specific recombinase XerD
MNQSSQECEDTAISPAQPQLRAGSLAAMGSRSPVDPWIGLSRDIIERFIEVACVQHSLTRSVRRGYRGDLVGIDTWMRICFGRTLVGARTSDVRDFLASRVRAGADTRLLERAVASLHEFFQYLQDTGSRINNPARYLRKVIGARRQPTQVSRAATR